jgi:hypothetical protein
MRAKVNRRCQDLLSVVVPNQEDPQVNRPQQFCHIEFLHRSVQDFLQQCEPVSEKLERLAGPGFNADRTLIACYIFIIKKSGQLSNNTPSWNTQALLHLSRIGDEYDASAARLLRELDEAMQLVFGRGQEHWSNRASEVPGLDGSNSLSSQFATTNPDVSRLCDLEERGNRDLLGHLIELNLIHPAREALTARFPAKRGRPLLDYALRFNPLAVCRWGYPNSTWHNPAMVELLLGKGYKVNDPIHIYGGRTVWDLYLAFLHNQQIHGGRSCKTTWLLINHGARPIKGCIVIAEKQLGTADRHATALKEELPMKEILASAFGKEEAENMCERIAKNEPSGNWWSWPKSWGHN